MSNHDVAAGLALTVTAGLWWLTAGLVRAAAHADQATTRDGETYDLVTYAEQR